MLTACYSTASKSAMLTSMVREKWTFILKVVSISSQAVISAHSNRVIEQGWGG